MSKKSYITEKLGDGSKITYETSDFPLMIVIKALAVPAAIAIILGGSWLLGVILGWFGY